MSIKTDYIAFFKYLKKPSITRASNQKIKLKALLFLFLLALIVDFSLDWLSMNHWLINILDISDSKSQEKEVYKDGFWFAVLTVALLEPSLEELLQRSYLTSFLWNNCLVPINISLIGVMLFNIRGNILFLIFGISLIVSRIVFVKLTKNPGMKFRFLKFYARNYFFYFYLSAISFGCTHIANYPIGNFIPILPILLVFSQIFAGLILGYVRVLMGLKWSISFHAFHNFIFVIILFVKHKGL